MAKRLAHLASKMPVVTLTGPRQSGKTTLVRDLFPEKPYENLDRIDARDLALQDPRKFLRQFPDGAILDEIQRAPQLLSYIQVEVDEADREGMFILTGSHQLEVHQAVAQSLAGRTALLRLLPLSLSELSKAGIELSLEEAIFKGGYPRIYRKELEVTPTYRDYVETYIERDVRQLIQIKELGAFQRFLKLCAGRVGQLINFQALSNEVGVSAPTIKQWISVLEASFLIVLLQPYHENFGKRLVKTPKLYFTDVGLACYLLGIENGAQVLRDPLYGALVENLILLELLKERLNCGRDPRLYFFRDTAGREVDFLHQVGHQLIPIEVKGASTFNADFLRNLKAFHRLAPERAKGGAVIYTGDLEQELGDFTLLNYRNAHRVYELESSSR